MWNDGHDMNGWGWLMMSFAILFWIGLIGLLAWLVTKSRRGTQERTGAGRGPGSTSPREVLDLRLARGEISVEEHGRLADAIRRGEER